MKKENLNKIIKILKNEGVGVMPTDTLYGLVGSAYSEKAINRIYKIKNRSNNKKLIILISSINDLKKFKIKITKQQKEILQKVWPHATSDWRGKLDAISVVLDGIAFRLPAKESLINILKKTGPLVAPSANPEGMKPAENISEAKKYFKNEVDFYLAGGELKGEPSNLIKINKNGKIVILRGKIKL